MIAEEALEAMKDGFTVVDEMGQYYNLLSEDAKKFVCEDEEIYRGRKSTGEFISIVDFLTSDQMFTKEERKSD